MTYPCSGCAAQSPPIASADLNGDGSPDIVVAAGSNGIAVFLDNGDGSFSGPTYYATAGPTNGVAIGDFNRDGKPNVVVSISGISEVQVLPGNGDGTFRTPVSSALPTGCDPAGPITAGDFNGDGIPDVAIGAECDLTGNGTAYCCGSVAVLLGNGDATFTPATGGQACKITSGAPSGPFACYNEGNIYGGVSGLTSADLRHDGKLDIIANDHGCGYDAGFVAVLLGNGDGSFTSRQYPIYCSTEVTVGDVNGDGTPDVVTTGNSGGFWPCFNTGDCSDLAVLLGDGLGGFSAPTFAPTDEVGPKPPVLADFTGNGHLDIAAPEWLVTPAGHTAMQVFCGNGDGTFGSPSAFPSGGSFPRYTVTADLNHDGKPDLVTAEDGAITVLLNAGGSCPTVTTPPIGGSETAAQNPADGNIGQKSSCDCQDTGVRSAGRVGHVAYPINAASGAFWHTFTDFAISGRGLALNFTRTYSSVFASVNGPLGFGWTGSYNMALTTDPSSGDVTVHQENGAQVTFTPGSGGSYTAPPRFTATLVKNGDGSFTFTRNAQATFSFSAAGQLTKETDLNGYATTFAYNGTGQLATVTDSAGRSLTFTYSGSHIVGVRDPAGRTVALTYDGNGNLASATDVNGGVTKFTYDASHLLLTMGDPRGGVVRNNYDGQGRIVSQADPLGHTTSYAYSGDNMSASGGTTTITDPNGSVTVEHYQYGLLISVTRGSGTPAAATSSYVYDPATLGVTSATDPNGHVTTKTYDASGNLLTSTDALSRKTVYTYNAFNEVLTVTDPLGVTTTNSYDAKGNLLSTSTPIGSSTATTTYAYGDSAHPGDVTSMTDPNGHTWTYTYDAQGDRASATDPSGDKTTYTYNTIGERLTMVSPSGNATGANPKQFVTAYTYDPFGDVLTVTDPLGDKTTNTYDPNRNLVDVVDPTGNITTNAYDADNELTKSVRTDSAGQLLQTLTTTYDANDNVLAQINGLGVATLTYAYDPLNRVASVTDGLGRVTTYTYDSAGNRVSLVDPAGRTTSFSYDKANELTAVAYSDGTTGVTYTYDANGQRLTMTDGTGTTSYTYDALHRLTKDVQGDGQAVSYAYDPGGNLTQITYPSGDIVNRSYDSANRLTSVSTWLSPPNTVTFGYDADSNLTTETYPNGVVAASTYDRADRLTSITDAKGKKVLQSFSYTRNPDGLVTKESPRKFGYDGLNRLTSDSLATAAYSYDAADELNKLTTSASTTTFGFDNANELTSSTASAGTATYIYDAQGNRMGATPPSGSPATSTYDQANRLTGFSQGTTTAMYVYNGDGLRLSKTVNATAEPFVWDIAEGLPLVLRDGTTSYVTGPGGLPLAQISATGFVIFYHEDQLGSTRMLTDSTGTVRATYTYGAYGNLIASNGTATQPFLFAGEYRDSESALYYLRARYYDPATANFLSRDPAVAKTMAPYAYVVGNPVNARDPSGLDYGCALTKPDASWVRSAGDVEVAMAQYDAWASGCKALNTIAAAAQAAPGVAATACGIAGWIPPVAVEARGCSVALAIYQVLDAISNSNGNEGLLAGVSVATNSAKLLGATRAQIAGIWVLFGIFCTASASSPNSQNPAP